MGVAPQWIERPERLWVFILALVAYSRSRKLWNSLPPVYRQGAVCYKDFWAASACIFPSKCHQPVDKESGKTHHLERFNNTWRQRVSRSGRKKIIYKKLDNSIGAMWYFIPHKNYVINQ